MHKDDFSVLMDQVIVRENLEGNSAADPKKKVQIMVCADFEDSSVPQEKVSFNRSALFQPSSTEPTQFQRSRISSQLTFCSFISKHLLATFVFLAKEAQRSWTPVPMDMLPPFKLCHKSYWEESLQSQAMFPDTHAIHNEIGIDDAKRSLKTLL